MGNRKNQAEKPPVELIYRASDRITYDPILGRQSYRTLETICRVLSRTYGVLANRAAKREGRYGPTPWSKA